MRWEDDGDFSCGANTGHKDTNYMAVASTSSYRDHFHVLVFCSVPSELEAARRVLENESDSTFEVVHTDVIAGLSLCREWNKSPLTVGLIAQADAGGNACTARLTEMKGLFSVDLAVMTGVCSAVEDVHARVEYGTVLVAKSTSTEEGGMKLHDGKFLANGNPEKIDKDVSVVIEQVICKLGSEREWLEAIPPSQRRASPRYVQEIMLDEVVKSKEGVQKRDLFGRLKLEEALEGLDGRVFDSILKKMVETRGWVILEDGVIKHTESGEDYMKNACEFPRPDEINVLMGSIGSIACVNDNLPNDIEQYRKHMANRKLNGIDMEAHYFMAHCKAAFPGSVSMVMKGILDYGTADRQEYYQAYAASTSAAFLNHLLRLKLFFDS